MSVFVDTNVLLYARDLSEPAKQPRAAEWLEHLWRTRTGRVSFQVLQEYYVNVTAKLRPGLPAADARDDVRSLFAWRPVGMDTTVVEAAWSITDRFGLSFWDAAVVAAAQLAACDRVLTEDLQDGRNLDGVVVVNPFLHAP